MWFFSRESIILNYFVTSLLKYSIYISFSSSTKREFFTSTWSCRPRPWFLTFLNLDSIFFLVVNPTVHWVNRTSAATGWYWPVASFTKEVNPRLAKHPLKTNEHLANRRLTSLVKEATGYPRLFWFQLQKGQHVEGQVYATIVKTSCNESDPDPSWFSQNIAVSAQERKTHFSLFTPFLSTDLGTSVSRWF